MEAERQAMLPWIIAHDEWCRHRGQARHWRSESELETVIADVLPVVRERLADEVRQLETELTRTLKSRRLAREVIEAALAHRERAA